MSFSGIRLRQDFANMKNDAIFPPRLLPEDTVGIAAPAGSFDWVRFARGVKVIESLGYKTHIPEALYQKKGYLAGSDKLRGEILNSLFLDDQIKGVFCARGGFGSLRMLPYVDFDLIKKHPKIFIGFSDISALLVSIFQNCKLVTYHGPVVTSLDGAKANTIETMANVLTAETVDPVLLKEGITIQHGKASGFIGGGNLCTLCHLTGTPYQPDFDDHILFLEDVAEPSYKIDRMLTQMKMAGMLNGVRGVLLGTFKNCGPFEEIVKIVKNVFGERGIPILAGLDAGHGEENRTIPFGCKALMDADSQCIEFETPSSIS